jgi:hypothetical protein
MSRPDATLRLTRLAAGVVLTLALVAPAGAAEPGGTAAAATPAAAVAPAPAPAEAPAPAADPWAYPERGLVIHPAGPGAGKERWAVGGLWQIAPMFTASYSRGLGHGFTVDARLQTIVLYNQLGVGGQWAYQVGPFSLGVMAHLDGFFGTLGKVFVQTSEFDSVGWGLLFDPGVKAGLQVAKDSWLTLKVEGYLSLYQAAKLGTLVLSPDSSVWEGFGTTLVVEYSPLKQGVIYYGVSLYNTRANYPLWFNVETSGSSDSINSRKIWYLGLLAGYEF